MSTITLNGLSSLSFPYVPLAAGPSFYTGSDPSGNAVYFPNGTETLHGSGFAYDTLGRLYSGTVSSVSISYPIVRNSDNLYTSLSESVSGISLPVVQILNSVATGLTLVPQYGGQNNTVFVNTPSVDPIPGNNTFYIQGTNSSRPTDQQSLTVNGTYGGNDTAVFAIPIGNNLRSDATLTGGGGNETVSLLIHAMSPASAITANLVLVDTLQFTDGSVYEDNQSPGAQAALEFEGIFGRLPDAINAGGFAQVATQSGTSAAAAQMLTTQEGSYDTAGLTTSQFVTRLYENMLHREPEPQGLAGWQADIDSGRLSRADVTATFASGIEAQQVNFEAFATGSVFAADPNAVEVLRAYELLLDRVPEASALAGNTAFLDSRALSLQAFYASVQSSREFTNDGPNQYGITVSTPYSTVYTDAHSDPFNGQITSLVTSQGVSHSS